MNGIIPRTFKTNADNALSQDICVKKRRQLYDGFNKFREIQRRKRDIGCNKVRSANSETKFVEDFTKGFY